ncbi:MAG: signal peptide peptidase SppA [Myxococcales bacterium]|nr:signal peptide peptidase SppA [Myxococcota bacterium]MDW8281446.1 signal peptide peptidase SppA [Myxococcales bacterium]
MAEATPKRPRRRRRFILFTVFVVILLSVLSLIGRRPKIDPGTVLVVSLEGEIPEAPPQDPFRQITSLLEQRDGTPSLHELRRALRHARDDSRIAGVLLEVRALECGWAVIDEIRGLISDVRAAGKPVQVLLSGDFAEEKEYAVASSASRIVLAPEAGLLLNGLLAEVTFFRGLLDWAMIEPEVLQLKEYKSAGEPFVNRRMSPAMREALSSLLSEIHGRFLAQVAEQRKIDPGKLRQMLDRGLLTSKEGLSAGLVDALGYRDEVEQAMGADQTKKRITVARYLKALADEPTRGNVALIYATGPIVAGEVQSGLGAGEVIEGPRLARLIRQAAEDEQIKAIVLRVDSPGGSAVGSDMIWREIQRTRSQKKPVVVSMSSVAASGGYWISMGADAIVAQPSTITGSIGVVSMHFNILPLWERIGLSLDTIKLGENADLMSPFRSWNAEHKARLIAWMQAVYDDFVARVARGRKLSESVVEPLAHGRIWSGTQAQQRKLVDEVGGLELAVRIARERAGLPPSGPEPVVFPRSKGVLAMLAEMGHAVARAVERPDPQRVLRDLVRQLGASGPTLLAPTIHIK